MNAAETFLNLFLRFQPLLKLSIDQYEMFIEAINKGYGLQDWTILKRICQRLWLKTNDPTAVARFDREFADWQEEFQTSISDWLDQLVTTPKNNDKKARSEHYVFQEDVTPNIPRRRVMPSPRLDSQQLSSSGEPVAIKDLSETIKISELPIDLPDIYGFCLSITHQSPISWGEKLDLPATLRLVQKQGALYDLVFEPILSPAPDLDLLVLVDDHDYLVPYIPVYQQLIEVLASNQWPAQIYRFTGYPTNFLFHWDDPDKVTMLKDLWYQPSIERRVMLIISDAGAASGIYSSERATKTGDFLQQAKRNIRQLYWLNPTPEQAWLNTTAIRVNEMLDGQMLPFSRSSWQKYQRSLP